MDEAGHGRLVAEQPSRPRRGTQALGCTPHRTRVEQPYSADPQQRKYLLALGPDGTTGRVAPHPPRRPATGSRTPRTPARILSFYAPSRPRTLLRPSMNPAVPRRSSLTLPCPRNPHRVAYRSGPKRQAALGHVELTVRETDAPADSHRSRFRHATGLLRWPQQSRRLGGLRGAGLHWRGLIDRWPQAH